MNNNILLYLVGGTGAAFVLLVLIYLKMAKKMQKSEYKKIQQLQQGTKKNTFSTEVLTKNFT